jgi:hypothetical protein
VCDRDRFAGRVGCSQSQRGTGSGAPTAQLQQKHALTPSPPDCLHRPPPPLPLPGRPAGCSWCLCAASWASSPLAQTPSCGAACGATCWRSRCAGWAGCCLVGWAGWLPGWRLGCTPLLLLACAFLILLPPRLPVRQPAACLPRHATARLPWVQEDDQDIQQEGLDSLTVDELRQACRWGAQACGVCVVD